MNRSFLNILNTDDYNGELAAKDKRLPVFKDTLRFIRSSSSATDDTTPLDMTEIHEEPGDLLAEYVANLIKEQAVAVQFAIDSENILDLNAITPEDARRLISENGYFGTAKTAGRIVEFAIESSGNDPARLVDIREGVAEGFREAEASCDGKLPDISHDTLKMIMAKLDEWAEQSTAA